MKRYCAMLGSSIVAGPFISYNQAMEAGHKYCRENGLYFSQVTVEKI